jgi:hypothetical protein
MEILEISGLHDNMQTPTLNSNLTPKPLIGPILDPMWSGVIAWYKWCAGVWSTPDMVYCGSGGTISTYHLQVVDYIPYHVPKWNHEMVLS